MKQASSFPIIFTPALREFAAQVGGRLKLVSKEASTRPKSPERFEQRIEHTLLRLDTTARDVESLIDVARTHRFRAVCCVLRDAPVCLERLSGTSVLVATVINFPLAGGTAAAAAAECKAAVAVGVDEIDFVIDLRSLRAGEFEALRDHAAAIVAATQGKPTKAILETGLLDPQQIVAASVAAEAAGVAFIKTSTGFGPRGASAEDIALMRAVVEDRLGIKASGGIRDYAQAAAMVQAGADVIGTSNGPNCLMPKN